MMNTAINYHGRSAVQAYIEPEVRNEAQVQKSHISRVTEVIIPQTSNRDNIILPLVASMTKQKTASNQEKNQDRWVTWITDRKPSYQQLKAFGANANSLRIIHVEESKDNRWIIWDALNTGNSHTVIADTHILNSGDIAEMETAASNGRCTGTLVRSH